MEEQVKCATLVKRNKFNILNYHSKDSESASINFIGVTGPMHIFNEVKYGNDSIEKIEEDQKQFKSKLNEITKIQNINQKINQIQ